MKRLFCQLATPALLTISVAGWAAAPVERDVRTVRTVQIYQPPGQAAARPIGAIDFSASGRAARRLGPWEVETDAFRDADGVIFYDDGSAIDRRRTQQFHRSDESRCTTLGNVTVCK